jgi:hypothetical protein
MKEGGEQLGGSVDENFNKVSFKQLNCCQKLRIAKNLVNYVTLRDNKVGVVKAVRSLGALIANFS